MVTVFPLILVFAFSFLFYYLLLMLLLLQTCMREDRLAAYEQQDLPLKQALFNEMVHGTNELLPLMLLLLLLFVDSSPDMV